ncbi:MAG TPA: hypothetical protein VD962_04535 [Rubricoccaceae bacterium]|nr:hypothetical protein [Rubricoccaceae bacterium]
MNAPPPRTYALSEFGCGLLAVLLTLPLVVVYLRMAPPDPGDYVALDVRFSSAEVMYAARGRHWLVVHAGGRRFQAEWPYLREIGYDAGELAAALVPGERLTLWVEHPDARTPRIRGIRSERVDAPLALGVRSDEQERRAVLILVLLFGGLGAAAMAQGTWQRWRERRRGHG